MAAAEETGHDGLGDARGKAGGNGCIGGASALVEDLHSRVGCCGMAGCDGSHAQSVKTVPILWECGGFGGMQRAAG